MTDETSELLTFPPASPTLPPTHVPLDDLQRRLDMLRRAGVREYHDGDLVILLATDRPAQVRTTAIAQGVLCEPINEV